MVGEHYLRLGLDTFFAAVSERWAGGPAGPFQGDRFEDVRPDSPDERPLLRVAYGDVGWQILRGMHDTVAALVRAGNHVVFDDMPIDAKALLDWRRALADVPRQSSFSTYRSMSPKNESRADRRRSTGWRGAHIDLIAQIDDVDLRLDATFPLDDLACMLVRHSASLPTATTGVHLSLR